MKKLSLKTEHLAELTPDELTQAIGAAYTGQTRCILSFQYPCQSVDLSRVVCGAATS